MDQTTAATPSPTTNNPSTNILVEEQDWREKEEKIEEMTYDQERAQSDQSINHMETDLSRLESYPLRQLMTAGIISAEKYAELSAAGLETLGRLVDWISQKID